jgi:hypothetical protein
MNFIICVTIGLPLALLIYLAFRLLKRPITAERSAEISGMTIGIVYIIPVVVFILAIPVTLLALPLGTLAWIFHPSWVPSWFDGAPTWFGLPSFVWIGGALLTFWAVLSLRSLYSWLQARRLIH